MTDKDRLDYLKVTNNKGITLLNFDVDWLIEQADKVERYEQSLKEIINIKNKYSDGDDSFMYVDDPYLYEAIKIAEKAIKNSSL